MENLNVELISHEKTSYFFGILGREMSSLLKALETLFYGTDYSKITVLGDLFVASFILFSLLLFLTVISDGQIYLIKRMKSNFRGTPLTNLEQLTGKIPAIFHETFYYLLHFLPLVTLSLYTLTPNSSNNLEYNDMSIAMGLSIAFILKVATLLLLDYAKSRIECSYNKPLENVMFFISILVVRFSTWEIIRIFNDIRGGYSTLEMLYGIIIGLPILVGNFIILFLFIQLLYFLCLLGFTAAGWSLLFLYLIYLQRQREL